MDQPLDLTRSKPYTDNEPLRSDGRCQSAEPGTSVNCDTLHPVRQHDATGRTYTFPRRLHRLPSDDEGSSPRHYCHTTAFEQKSTTNQVCSAIRAQLRGLASTTYDTSLISHSRSRRLIKTTAHPTSHHPRAALYMRLSSIRSKLPP